jgi:UDP-N-acetylglucosamine transferase subunit ALG13
MIFVTVGTHEQPFDRLVREVDKLAYQGIINEEIFIQLGYSQYIPTHCDYKDFLTYFNMEQKVQEAHIVIMHGGAGSIKLITDYRKIPIVVPRQRCYGEHVDDNQVEFTKFLEHQGRVLTVYDINDLREKIDNYDSLVKQLDIHKFVEDANKRVTAFAHKLDEICMILLKN